MSDELTFRDFAGAIMGGDWTRAAEVLQVLLGVDAATATQAAEHFQKQMASGPDFMMKAMGMRQVVGSGDRDALIGLLGECFGLTGDAAQSSADAVLKRYA